MTITTIDPTSSPAGAAPPSSSAVPPGRAGLVDVLRAEWTKLRTVRSTPLCLGLVALLGVGLSAIACAETASHWATMAPGARLSFDPTQTSLLGIVVAQLVLGVMAILAVSSEYGTGTIRATLAATPRRGMVLLSKVGVFAALSLVVSEAVSFAAYFVGQALLVSPTPHTTLASPQALRQVVFAGLYLTGLGLFALGLATIIRHTAGAIAAFVGCLLVAPLILQAMPLSIQQNLRHLLPTQIGNSMTQLEVPLHYAWSPWASFALLCVYAALTLVVGGVLFLRRDA